MRSKLDAMRKALASAISAIPAKEADKTKPVDQSSEPEDPRTRLVSLQKEVASVLSEVNDLSAKEDHAEKYDRSRIDSLETTVTEVGGRVQAGLGATASA